MFRDISFYNTLASLKFDAIFIEIDAERSYKKILLVRNQCILSVKYYNNVTCAYQNTIYL
jgi:hypothetical protein